VSERYGSPKDVLARHLRDMGDELGRGYSELSNGLSRLQVKWCDSKAGPSVIQVGRSVREVDGSIGGRQLVQLGLTGQCGRDDGRDTEEEDQNPTHPAILADRW
jgi:hypothetical protein